MLSRLLKEHYAKQNERKELQGNERVAGYYATTLARKYS